MSNLSEPLPYSPAPHLANSSFLSSAQLVYYFEDFYATLGRISSAPEYVFERLVANLSDAFAANFEHVANTVREGTPQLGIDNRRADLRSTGAPEQVATLEARNNELMSVNERLEAELAEMGERVKAINLEHQEEIGTLETRNSELRLSKERLVAGAAETRERMKTDDLDHHNKIATLESRNSELQVSKERLKGNLVELRAKIAAMEENSSETTLKSCNRELRLSSDQLVVLARLRTINDRFKLDLDAVGLAVLVTKNPRIGVFYTDDVPSDSQPCTSGVTTVFFPSTYEVPPILPFGIMSMATAGDGKFSLAPSAKDIARGSFQINPQTSCNTRSQRVGYTWIEVEPNNVDFQCGEHFTAIDPGWSRETTFRVDFPRRYCTPPQVVIYLRSFEFKPNARWTVRTYATDITTTGFEAHIRYSFGPDPDVISASVSWVAYTARLAGVFTGSFVTQDPCRGSYPTPESNGLIEFGNTFTSPPRVMMAINHINIPHQQSLQVSLRASEITNRGMSWHVDGMTSSDPFIIGASIIALS